MSKGRQINLKKENFEPVRIWYKKKKSGTIYRVFHDFRA